jgi:histidinol-phosphatase (PHP family)
MALVDYHTHSGFSCDAQATMTEMCRAALELGLEEIGFTEHYDLHPLDPCKGYLRVEAWWEQLESCRSSFAGSLTVRAGIEISEPHQHQEQVRALLDSHHWDYALGSLHWVGEALIFDPAYFARPEEETYGAYFAQLLDMVEGGAFDVLAHMDIVKRRGIEAFGPFRPVAYEGPIREVLRAVARREMALELNTITLRRPTRELCPSERILAWFREEGGRRVTIGSDAHRPEEIAAGFEEAVRALRRAGFEEITRFESRRPFQSPLPSQWTLP